jgi:hypothetical protein
LKTPRFAMIGVGVLATATFALTGCGSSGSATTTNSNSPAAVSTVDAQAALTKAGAALATTGYNVSTDIGGGTLTGTGSIDPGKGAAIEQKGTIQGVSIDINVVVVGTDFYAKLDAGPLGAAAGVDSTKWYKVDTSKVDASKLPVNPTSPDVLGISGLVSGIKDLKATDSTHITGTIDLTAVKSALTSESDLASAAAGATAAPFTATLDDQGRFSEVQIGSGASSVDVKFSSYGSPAAITAPSGAVDAPPTLYQILGS